MTMIHKQRTKIYHEKCWNINIDVNTEHSEDAAEGK